MKTRIANLESEQFSTKNSVKILEGTLEQKNSAVTHCMETLDSLNIRVNTPEKKPNELSITESSHTAEVNNKENSNTNQKQEKPVLMNQLKDWQSHQNNVIVYNIPETDLVNSNDTAIDLLSKFKQLIADVCEVTYDKNDIISVFRLGKKSDDNSRIRRVIVKFSSLSLKTNLIRNVFKLQDSIYSISVGRTKEECNAFKKSLKEKKSLNKSS